MDLDRVGGRIDGVSITLKSPEENTEILKKICIDAKVFGLYGVRNVIAPKGQ